MFAPRGKTCQADGVGELCWRAELGPSCWRNADIAANGRSEGGLAVLHDWIGTCTQAAVPPKTARLWTAAKVLHWRRNPSRGQRVP